MPPERRLANGGRERAIYHRRKAPRGTVEPQVDALNDEQGRWDAYHAPPLLLCTCERDIVWVCDHTETWFPWVMENRRGRSIGEEDMPTWKDDKDNWHVASNQFIALKGAMEQNDIEQFDLPDDLGDVNPFCVRCVVMPPLRLCFTYLWRVRMLWLHIHVAYEMAAHYVPADDAKDELEGGLGELLELRNGKQLHGRLAAFGVNSAHRFFILALLVLRRPEPHFSVLLLALGIHDKSSSSARALRQMLESGHVRTVHRLNHPSGA